MSRSTIISIILFVVLAAAYYYLRNQSQAEGDVLITPEPSQKVEYLFSPVDGTPTKINVQSNTGESVQLERDADNAWALTLPTKTAADPTIAEALASQITTIQIMDHVPDVEADVVGLSAPNYTVVIEFSKANLQRKLDIGVVTPTETGYYVRDTSGEIVIVSRSSIEALINLLLTPPYLETPTPSLVPSVETPNSTIPGTTEVSSTPTP